MTATATLARARSTVSRKVLAGVIAFVAVFGIAFGTAAPANAGIGMWYVSSSWFQSFAALSSTGGDGYFQARAVLGNRTNWGQVSQYNTKIQADGFSPNHSGCLLRNNRVWACG